MTILTWESIAKFAVVGSILVGIIAFMHYLNQPRCPVCGAKPKEVVAVDGVTVLVDATGHSWTTFQ